MKIHLQKKSGNTVYKNLPACGTRPRRNSHARVYNLNEFKHFSKDKEMVCEKCLATAIEQKRLQPQWFRHRWGFRLKKKWWSLAKRILMATNMILKRCDILATQTHKAAELSSLFLYLPINPILNPPPIHIVGQRVLIAARLALHSPSYSSWWINPCAIALYIAAGTFRAAVALTTTLNTLICFVLEISFKHAVHTLQFCYINLAIVNVHLKCFLIVV